MPSWSEELCYADRVVPSFVTFSRYSTRRRSTLTGRSVVTHVKGETASAFVGTEHRFVIRCGQVCFCGGIMRLLSSQVSSRARWLLMPIGSGRTAASGVTAKHNLRHCLFTTDGHVGSSCRRF